MKRVLLTIILSVLACIYMQAQDRTVSGQVTDEGGNPLPGVTVVIKGTTSGTATDGEGKYRLSVPANAILSYNYLGYVSQEIVVGSQTVIDVTLAEDIQQLDEVVVTAFGVERDQKALGYSVQQVSGESISRAATPNPIDALNGKAAGVQITRSSGTAGGGSRVVIRGTTSLIGDNQALIVIDGVRVNNQTNYTEGTTAGTAQSNRLSDLNPEDIESMSVLKGAAATALYGTAGSTGVIVITTKKGAKKKGFDISFSSRAQIDEISQMPSLQSQYAQGSGGVYRGPETGSSGSWGPLISDLRYDGDSEYPYDKNGRLVLASDPSATSQVANVYNNIDDYFQTGSALTNSLSISGGNEQANFRLSYSNHDEEGIVPNNTYDRNTFMLSSSLKATDKLNFSGTINYTRSDYTRIQQGSNTSGVMLGLLRTPATFDNSNGLGAGAVDDASAYIFADGSQRNYRGGGGYDNPFWISNLATKDEKVDRTFGSFTASYNFNQWAQLSLTVGSDITAEERKQDFEINTRTAAGGRVIHDNYKIVQNDAYLRLSGGGDVGSEFAINYFAGINLFNYRSENAYIQGDGLAFQNFVNLANASNIQASNTISRYRTLGIFGSFEASYRNTFFLTVTGRQDYDSRLGVPTNEFKASDIGFFYPSISTSIVFSELIDVDFLTFGKLRASYAEVGAGPPSAYSTSSVFVSAAPGDGWGDPVSFPISGISGFEVSGTLGNPELKPEKTKTIELGLDMRFLNNRLGLDVAYFTSDGEDQILSASLPRSTGYTQVFLNSGALSTEGWEAVLTANPVKTKNFNWNVTANFTKVLTTVDALAPGLERLQIGGFTGTGIFLVAGNSYGSIFGGAYLREGAGGPNDDGLNIPEGPIVVTDDPASAEYGYQAVDGTLRAIGDTNPDFTVGITNTFDYKGFSLSFLIDWKKGGEMWNGTNWALSFFGRSQLTADTRNETPFAIDGVLSDGSPNTINIVRDQDYWQSSVGGFGSVDEQFVQKTNWVRLRELSLGYTFNNSLFKNSFIKGLNIGVYGRNLWLDTPYDGVDPETSLTGTGNSQGLDYFNMPGTKSYGFYLNANL